jgi:hypothetical protein
LAKELIPAGILPIARPDGGELCLHRHAQAKWSGRVLGSQTLWEENIWNEDDLYPVFSDFESFLESLHDYYCLLALIRDMWYSRVDAKKCTYHSL